MECDCRLNLAAEYSALDLKSGGVHVIEGCASVPSLRRLLLVYLALTLDLRHIAILASYFSLAQQVLLGGNSNASNLTTPSGVTASPAPEEFAVGTELVSRVVTLLFSLSDWLKILAFGAVMETLRRLFFFAKEKMTASIWITARFEEYDSSYDWMMLWLAKQPAWTRARDLDISTRSFGLQDKDGQFDNATMLPGEETDNNLSLLSSRSIAYLPAASLTCSMWYRRRYMEVTRIKTNTGRRGQMEEKLEISILTRHHRVLNELLREAKKAYMAAAESLISIYISDSNNNWSKVASRAKRDMNSIILDPGVSEVLVEDARDFLGSKAWYAARGIPFRRGYLLYGAPGSGKTSIISSIAGELGLDIYMVSLSRSGLDDSALSELISNLPEKCVALMEDIDAAFTHSLNRDAEPAGDDAAPGAPPTAPTSRLSLSGLLNALDGVAAQEGRILYATTNKYSALDPALCRPGRMDIHVEFKLASKYQARRLFTSFYLPADEDDKKEKQKEEERGSSSSDAAPAIDAGPTPTTPLHLHPLPLPPKLPRAQITELAARFADAIPERTVSMAALQGFLMTHKVRPQEAVRMAAEWVESERAARSRQLNEGREHGGEAEEVKPS
ncbi:P-loop containing nucleoside triphosphate hydrolase protein [Mycena rosella]|uniref:P-loop containing nucleoside triphosphate hydrolase protein n=1 Tax=Mycena rosella TaxID=1033263 RepID=A0AAD7DSJ3_MYCRO|nr:P-loop containing nucleoside triphosphate hydrolase protein [Mycena rosella]